MTDKSRTFSVPRDLLEKGLNSPNGIRVWFATQEKAQAMINRMATVKTEDRKLSCKTYQIGHALYNTSSYDGVATYTQPVEVHKEPTSEGYPTSGVWLYICPPDSASSGLFIEEL